MNYYELKIVENYHKLKSIVENKGGILHCAEKDFKGYPLDYEVECILGHKWKADLANLFKGCWCKTCFKNNLIKQSYTKLKSKAILKGGNLITKLEDYVPNKYCEMECSEKHKWPVKPANIITNDTWCPICASTSAQDKHGVGEEICRTTLEQIFGKSFNKVKNLQWLKNPETNCYLELDGYCDDLKLAFEYQGFQHFVNPKIIKRDRIKQNLCRENKIKLITIPQFSNYVKEWGRTITYNNLIDYLKWYGAIHYIDLPINFPKIDITRVFDKGIFLKKRLEQLKKLAQNNNGELLSIYYIDTETKLEWLCKTHNHIIWMTPHDVLSGRWCYKGGREAAAKKLKLTLEDLDKKAKKHDPQGKCLLQNDSQYTNAKSKIPWKCGNPEHPIFFKSISKIKLFWCKRCTFDIKKLTIEELDSRAKIHDPLGKCLLINHKDYVDSQTKIPWKCGNSEHPIFYKRPASINYYWCNLCQKGKNGKH